MPSSIPLGFGRDSPQRERLPGAPRLLAPLCKAGSDNHSLIQAEGNRGARCQNLSGRCSSPDALNRNLFKSCSLSRNRFFKGVVYNFSSVAGVRGWVGRRKEEELMGEAGKETPSRIRAAKIKGEG